MIDPRKKIIEKLVFMLLVTATCQVVHSQQVEVQGELKVTQMTVDDTQDNLVIHNPDGTFGTRSVASLPPPSPPIDTTRNLASDFELAKHLCDCPNLPPFMIKKLLDSGYTQEELVGSGVDVQEVIDAQRNGILIDTRDNKSYKTVKIGDQIWMAENLNIGTRVQTGNNQIDDDIIEKYCNNNDDVNCDTYGGLYQWNEMMQYATTEGTQGICPTGWHLPTDTEWKTLEMQLGMTQAEADASGTVYRGTDQGSQLAGNEPLWTVGALDNNGAFGSSGFTALPAGLTNANLTFFTYFWSSSELASRAWSRILSFSFTKVARADELKSTGFSVRCVQD